MRSTDQISNFWEAGPQYLEQESTNCESGSPYLGGWNALSLEQESTTCEAIIRYLEARFKEGFKRGINCRKQVKVSSSAEPVYTFDFISTLHEETGIIFVNLSGFYARISFLFLHWKRLSREIVMGQKLYDSGIKSAPWIGRLSCKYCQWFPVILSWLQLHFFWEALWPMAGGQ